MAHHEENLNLSPEEIKFNELVHYGDDFMKIEIYRFAREWYNKALELKINREVVEQKLENCNEKIKTENRIITAVVAIMSIIALIAYFS